MGSECREVTAWKCGGCGWEFTGPHAESEARHCCAKKHCQGCGCDMASRPRYLYCPDCLAKRQRIAYMAMPSAEWDGTQMLIVHDDDRYFHNLDECLEWVAESLGLPDEDAVTQEHVEQMQIVLCEPYSPTYWDLCETFEEYIAEDSEPPAGWGEVEKHVNDWLAGCDAWCWMPGKKRLMLAKEQADGDG